MLAICYKNQSFPVQEAETVLECLTRNGVQVPFSCRSGSCQTCLMQATQGLPPADAQRGLKDSQKARNCFLACICRPSQSLTVSLPDSPPETTTATVKGLELLNADVMRVLLESHSPIEYRPGQFVQLFFDPTLSRSYSIASLPARDRHLELHVRRLAQGRVSGWIHDELRPGHRVELSRPIGDCFYVPGRPEQGLLLIGTGSGLAPLYGIARDALDQGHTGPVRLFHGSRHPDGLYLSDELNDLGDEFRNFDYVPCVSGPDVPHGYTSGRPSDVALQGLSDPKGWRIFLCGHPDMVATTRKKAFLAGAAMKDIYADAFRVGPNL